MSNNAADIEKGLNKLREAKENLQKAGASEELAEKLLYIALKQTNK